MQLQSLLFSALASPLGIVITTTDPVNLRAKLYPLRKQDPGFASLHFVIPPTAPESTLWIVKKPEANA